MLWLLIACRSKMLCEDPVSASLQLTVIDENGDPIVPDSIEYSHQDGPRLALTNLDSEFTIGRGLEGDFTVWVSFNGLVIERDYSVERDGCSLNTISDELSFERNPCLPESIPGFQLNTIDANGEPLVADSVEWSEGSEWRNASCVGSCTSWEGAHGVLGAVDILASYGEISERVSIDIEPSDCGPQTETVTIMFDVIPDEVACFEQLDEGWETYFETYVGCNDLQLIATDGGGFQQLALEMPESIDDLLEIGAVEHSVPDLFGALSFGSGFEDSCTEEGSPSLLYQLVEGSLNLTTLSSDSESLTFLAVLNDSVLIDENECVEPLLTMVWDEITIPLE